MRRFNFGGYFYLVLIIKLIADADTLIQNIKCKSSNLGISQNVLYNYIQDIPEILIIIYHINVCMISMCGI